MTDFARDHLSPIDYERITASITESTLYGNRVASGVQARQPLCFEETVAVFRANGTHTSATTTELRQDTCFMRAVDCASMVSIWRCSVSVSRSLEISVRILGLGRPACFARSTRL